MNLSISAASRVGCVRDINEDMVLFGEYFIRDEEYSETKNLNGCDRYLIALADGMGGHQSGEVASSETLHHLQYYFNDLPVGLNAGELNEAIVMWLNSINNTIDIRGREEAVCRGMGTTLVSLAYYGGDFYWINCGDSRIYRLHDNHLRQLSTDHSLNTLMGEREHSHVITNCIGGGCKNSFIDMVCCTPDVLPGDTFLLCSDGLTDMVPDDQIETMLAGDADASALCQRAEDLGGLDNVSAIVVRVGH